MSAWSTKETDLSHCQSLSKKANEKKIVSNDPCIINPDQYYSNGQNNKK